MTRKALLLSLAILVLLALAVPAGGAEAPPPLPAAYWGKVIPAGGQSPDLLEGKILRAEVRGAPVGSIEIGPGGVFGGPRIGDEKLLVLAGENDLVEFFVEGIEATPSVTWVSGDTRELVLTLTSKLPELPGLTGITVTPSSITLAPGQTRQLSVTANYSDGSSKDVTGQASYKSLDPNVAKVSGSGLVTAVRPGSTTIEVTYEGKSGTASVTVRERAAEPGAPAGPSPKPEPVKAEDIVRAGQELRLSLAEGTAIVVVPAGTFAPGTKVSLEQVSPDTEAWSKIASSAGFAASVDSVILLTTDTGARFAPVPFTFKVKAPDPAAGLYYFDEVYGCLVPVLATREGDMLTARVRALTYYAVLIEKDVQFPDTPEQHWARPYITSLARKGILSGFPDGKYYPQSNLTREQIAKITALAAMVPSTTGSPVFPDAKNRWSEAFVASTSAAGIIKGYPDGTFGPDRPVTRAELVTMVVRTLNLSPEGTPPFRDSLAHWAERYIAAAAKAGIIAGYPDGTFRPNAPVTRAEAAKIVGLAFGFYK